MSASQPQGHRSGEGTSGLWNHIRDDDERKEKEPQGGLRDDFRQQYRREAEQRQPQPLQGPR
jgi:hypothetical protein